MKKRRVTLYTRAGCCLCQNAQQVLVKARQLIDFEYEEIDIDADPQLRQRYNDQVPVIAIDGRSAFRYGVDLQELLRRLETGG